MAEADAGAVLNHNSNLKLKSGVAPILDMREAGMDGAKAGRQLRLGQRRRRRVDDGHRCELGSLHV